MVLNEDSVIKAWEIIPVTKQTERPIREEEAITVKVTHKAKFAVWIGRHHYY